jgi:carbon-monoxide dehydrogenase medium subunit
MCTHAAVAAAPLVRERLPGLAALAGGIADAQVRQRGTLGGSLANADPAACWPAGVLAAGATLVTDRREIAADDFFTGLFATALEPDEVLVGARFAGAQALHYAKEEQPASRFALAGVAVARQAGGAVRVAVTGLGQGVFRWAEAESRLAQRFAPEALDGLRPDAGIAHGDLHASADYRCHLAGVLARRAVRRFGGAAA